MKTLVFHRSPLLKLTFSAMFLAIGMVLPFFTGNIPEIGASLCPMHIPVLLCGYICGAPWGTMVGMVLPLLRSAVIHMPPMMPTAAAMAFELAAYGLVAGLFPRSFVRKPAGLYVSLLTAMTAGRIVWGLASAVLYASMGSAFSWALFAAGAVLNALPGIVLQLILIPAVIYALTHARLIPLDK
ncbi:MAG: ECF transporter S component [Clostridia bacterium]|nr:ECF transporter S component [Clostridia bacterium]